MKPYLIIFAIILTGTIAKAQSAFKTNESISSQLKNGTAPGFKYRKVESVTKEKIAEPVSMENSDKLIRNNSRSGAVQERATAGTKSQTDLSVQTQSSVPLVSDKPAERSVPVEQVVPPKIVQ